MRAKDRHVNRPGLGTAGWLRIMPCVLVWAGMAVSAAELVELKIKLPPPPFGFGPVNLKSSHLDPETGKRRRPLMVPEGVALLSVGKPVSASDDQPSIGRLEMVTDGDKGSRQRRFVELGSALQWVQIDLEKACEIYAIVVWHFYYAPRICRDVVVSVSNDPEFVKEVEQVFNNDHDDTAGLGAGKDYEYIETNEGRLVDCRGVKARYVRLYSNGNTSNDVNHYIEVEVYGRPPK